MQAGSDSDVVPSEKVVTVFCQIYFPSTQVGRVVDQLPPDSDVAEVDT